MRGRAWTGEEDAIIERMMEEKASLRKIAEKLTDRTVQAIEKRISRLGLHCRQITKFFLPEIVPETLERGEVLKILSDAIERLRKGGEMDKAELKRLQTIACAARNYIKLLDSHENYAELEERIRSLEETAAWEAEHAEKEARARERKSSVGKRETEKSVKFSVSIARELIREKWLY